MRQHYRLHGLHLRTVSNHPAVQRLLHHTLRCKGAKQIDKDTPLPPDSIDATLDFSVDRASPPPPVDAHHITTGEHFGIDAWRTSGQMILHYGDTTITLNSETGVAEGAIATDLLGTSPKSRDQSILYYLAAFSLSILLRARGWYPLHAAALVYDGRGILLPARSGQGKSTIALSLLRNGWTALSDDTVLLRFEEDQITTYSFRRDFRVGRDTAACFPEFDGPNWPTALSDPSKWRVDIDRIYPGQSASSCTSHLLVVPEIVDAPTSHVEPIGPKPALEQLLNEGGFFFAPDSNVANRHLAVLRHLTNQTRTYRLHAGRDILENPRTPHTLLTPLFREPTPPDGECA